MQTLCLWTYTFVRKYVKIGKTGRFGIWLCCQTWKDFSYLASVEGGGVSLDRRPKYSKCKYGKILSRKRGISNSYWWWIQSIYSEPWFIHIRAVIFMLISSMTSLVKFYNFVLLPLNSEITAGSGNLWSNFPRAVLLDLPEYDFWIYCFDRSFNFDPLTYILFCWWSPSNWSIHIQASGPLSDKASRYVWYKPRESVFECI